MDVGAEAFVVRRPEMPALLAELGLAERPTRHHRCASADLQPGPAAPAAGRERSIGIPSSAESMAGLVNDATLARIAAEPDQPLSWQPGADPAVGRPGRRPVRRAGGGPVGGSDAQRGLCGIGGDHRPSRRPAPTLAAASGRAAPPVVTDAVRQALTSITAGPIFGAVGGGYPVLVEELVRRSRIDWVRAAVDTHRGRRAPAGPCATTTGAEWHADAVIFAVPAARLARLVAGVAPRTAAAAGRIDSASSAVLAMAVPRGIDFPQNSGVLVASGERLRAKAITLSSRKWGRRTDVELLRLSFGRFGDDLATAHPTTSCWPGRWSDLATVFGLTVDPVDVRVQRWMDAMPQYGPGHARPGRRSARRSAADAARWPAAISTGSACRPASVRPGGPPLAPSRPSKIRVAR